MSSHVHIERVPRFIIESQQFGRDLLMKVFHRAKMFEEGEASDIMRGKILASLFYEPSTRTRLSFEAAAIRLGGHSSRSYCHRTHEGILWPARRAKSLWWCQCRLSVIDVVIEKLAAIYFKLLQLTLYFALIVPIYYSSANPCRVTNEVHE